MGDPTITVRVLPISVGVLPNTVGDLPNTVGDLPTLAVDRDAFSNSVTKKLLNHPLVTIDRNEIHNLPLEDWEHSIIATGPLTSKSLSNDILNNTDQKSLAFFDAIAPIVFSESIDMSKAWMQSRYDKGDTEEEKTAYLNCPMDKEP